MIDNDSQVSPTCMMLGTDAEQIPAPGPVAAVYAGLDPRPADLISNGAQVQRPSAAYFLAQILIGKGQLYA